MNPSKIAWEVNKRHLNKHTFPFHMQSLLLINLHEEMVRLIALILSLIP